LTAGAHIAYSLRLNMKSEPTVSVISEELNRSVTIIIPAYNDAEGLAVVLQSLLSQPDSPYWSILVIDDGSTDETPDILKSFQPQVRVIRHPSNRGYGAALKTGVMATRTENVLFMDADGQHDPAYVPDLISALKKHECVFTARKSSAGIPWVRRPGKWILHRVCNFLAATRIPDINCGLRAGRRHIYMMMLELLPNGFSFSTTSLLYVLRSRFSQTFIPITCKSRLGSSSVRIVYDGLKTMLLALRLMMLFDPMRAFGYPAIGFILVGLAYQTYIILTFRLVVVGGSLLSILIGVLLFFFGLLGDQISSLRKEISSFNCLLWENIQAQEESRRD
jgi:glycosyltransferase involved in cell wall biosynthesis